MKYNLTNFVKTKIRSAFIRLRNAFIETPIHYHFDLKRYIWIQIDTFSFIINELLSQLLPNNNHLTHDNNHLRPNFFSKKAQLHQVTFLKKNDFCVNSL